MLQLNLQRLGHQVFSAVDGAEAVAAFQRESVDLILMDVQMPGTDGLEASRQIRALEQVAGRSAVPIIALTASVLDRDRQAALDAGMNGFAGKPLDMPALLAEMARLLGQACSRTAADSQAAQQGLFDWQRGAMLWGGPLTMTQAVSRFLDEQADCPEVLRQAFACKHWDELQAQAHRLRGLAGNLGLPALQNLLAELEQEAVGQSAASCQQLLDELPRLLALIGANLPQQPQSQETVVACPSTTLDVQTLKGLQSDLRRLQSALQRGALDEGALQGLAPLVGWLPDELTALQEAVEDFDFEQAGQVLEAMLGKLQGLLAE